MIVVEPDATNVTKPLLSTVAHDRLLLVYVFVPLLALDTDTLNGESPYVFEIVESNATRVNVVVPRFTTSEDEISVGALYCDVCACCAVITVSPAATSVTVPVFTFTVAHDVLLLVYVTAPELALFADTSNVALSTPNVFEIDEFIDTRDSVVVPRATDNELLVTLAALYLVATAT